VRGRGIQASGVRVGEDALVILEVQDTIQEATDDEVETFSTEIAQQGSSVDVSKLDVSVTDPDGNDVQTDVQYHGQQVQHTYKPEKVGKFTVKTSYGGQNIRGSPFLVNVSPAIERKTRAFGPGLSGGIAGYPACFTVDRHEDETLSEFSGGIGCGIVGDGCGSGGVVVVVLVAVAVVVVLVAVAVVVVLVAVVVVVVLVVVVVVVVGVVLVLVVAVVVLVVVVVVVVVVMVVLVLLMVVLVVMVVVVMVLVVCGGDGGCCIGGGGCGIGGGGCGNGGGGCGIGGGSATLFYDPTVMVMVNIDSYFLFLYDVKQLICTCVGV